MYRYRAILARAVFIAATAVPLGQAAAAHADGIGGAPFSARFAEQFAVSACPAGTPAGTMCASATGTGKATSMDHPIEVVQGAVNLNAMNLATGCAPDISSGTLTTKDGQLRIVAAGTFRTIAHFGPTGTTGTSTSIYRGTLTLHQKSKHESAPPAQPSDGNTDAHGSGTQASGTQG